MSTEIIEGDIKIAEFMGRKFYAYKGNSSYKTGFRSYKRCIEAIDKYKWYGYIPQLGYNISLGEYHSNWDALIPACYKWDNLFKEADLEYPKALQYEKLCDSLDNAVTLYKILPAFNQLVENIKWYQNQILNNTIK